MKWVLCLTQTWETFYSDIHNSAGTNIHCMGSLFAFLSCDHVYRGEKKGQKQKANTLLELLVFGAPSFSQESLSQLLQIP